MRNLEFKYIRAKNFICFGQDGIEIDFRNLNNIVHITGRNLDYKEEDGDKAGSNAVGKSSLPEIITYGLFGKTIKPHKKVKIDDVIHNKVGRELEVEVQWDNFRVLRTRKPNSLRLWESAEGVWNDTTEITLGGAPATQQLIEDKLGLSYEAFINIVVFTDNDINSFLEADAAKKREIVENMLALAIYRQYFEETKVQQKLVQQNIDQHAEEYKIARHEFEVANERLHRAKEKEVHWRESKRQEIDGLKSQAVTLKQQLSLSDNGAALQAFNEAQDRMAEITGLLQDKSEALTKLNTRLDEGNKRYDAARKLKNDSIDKLDTFKILRGRLADEIVGGRAAIQAFQSKTGTQCPSCFSKVEAKNFEHVISNEAEKIKVAQEQSVITDVEIATLQEEVNKNTVAVAKLEEIIKKTKEDHASRSGEIVKLQSEMLQLQKIKRPEATTDQRLLEQRIADLKTQAMAKAAEMKGESPFEEIIREANKELDERDKFMQAKKTRVAELESHLPYFDYFKAAFGDNGIRKFVINDIIPALNGRIDYWLHILLYNNYSLRFDDQLDESIERNPADGNAFVYTLLSRSQKRRLNLAVSQAFAYVMSLSADVHFNLVFLDEVSSSVDFAGIPAIYDMILELSKEKKVFVTTHERDLQEMLDGQQTLRLEMRDGFTRLIS